MEMDRRLHAIYHSTPPTSGTHVVDLTNNSHLMNNHLFHHKEYHVCSGTLVVIDHGAMTTWCNTPYCQQDALTGNCGYRNRSAIYQKCA